MNILETIEKEREETARKLAALDFVINILKSGGVVLPESETEQKEQTTRRPSRKKREEISPDFDITQAEGYTPRGGGGICDV